MDTTANERVGGYTFKFNKEHRPPGWKWDAFNNVPLEPIETALNRLGIVMINDIPVVAVTAVHFKRDESVMNDKDLATRLLFVMNEPVENNRLYLNVQAPPTSVAFVRSNDIRTASGAKAPILQNVEITLLPPGGRLNLELILERGTARINGAQFTVVTSFHFYKTKSADEAYIFEIELLKGFEDGAYIFKTATEVLEGKLDPHSITAAEMEELQIDW